MSSARTSLAEAGSASEQGNLLAEDARRLLRSLFDVMLETGSVPPTRELAGHLETTEEAIRSGLAALVAADYVALDASDQVACLYPFSATPTPHSVVIDEQRRHAMCAIDALGIPAMLDQELAVEGRCAVCDAPIALRVRPGAVVATAPPTAMVVARRDEAEPAFAACCPFTVFVCGQEHAEQFSRRISGARALPLSEALARAEEIFGGLLADALPATRPRGKRWGDPSPNEPVLFTQSGCAESAQVRAWLTDHDISFIERDAGADAEAAQSLAATGTFATPLLVIGSKKVLGFRPEALTALLRTASD